MIKVVYLSIQQAQERANKAINNELMDIQSRGNKILSVQFHNVNISYNIDVLITYEENNKMEEIDNIIAKNVVINK